MSTEIGAAVQADEAVEPVEQEVVETPEKKTASKPAPKAKTKADKEETSEPKSQPAEKQAKEKGPHPWEEDLRKIGFDPDEFPPLNEYMTERQGYITQKEQELAEWGELFDGDRDAAGLMSELLNELREDPEAAFYKLGTTLGILPDDFTQEMGQEDQDFEGEVGDELEGDEAPEDENARWVNAQRQKEMEQEEDARYGEFLESIATEVGEGFDPHLFNLHMVASEGDVNEAYAGYMQYHEKLAPAPTPDAPPVTGSGGPEPRAKSNSNQSIEGAFDEMFSEDRARRGR